MILDIALNRTSKDSQVGRLPPQPPSIDIDEEPISPASMEIKSSTSRKLVQARGNPPVKPSQSANLPKNRFVHTKQVSATTPSCISHSSNTVHFDARVRVRKIPSLQDIPLYELDQIYFSKDDFLDIRLELREKLSKQLVERRLARTENDLTLRRNNRNIDPDYDCHGNFYMRGLEGELPNQRAKRKLIKELAKQAVMKIQFEQYSIYGSLCDHEALSRRYRQHSQPAVQLALMTAQHDADIARILYQQWR